MKVPCVAFAAMILLDVARAQYVDDRAVAPAALPAAIMVQPRDFNADGRADLLLYDPATGTSYTGLSKGDGTYQVVYNLFTPGFNILRTGDFNADFKADLILYNSQTSLAYLGLGNGDGTFTFRSVFWYPGYNVVESAPYTGGASSDLFLYNASNTTQYAGVSNGDGSFDYKQQPSGVGLGVGAGFTAIGIARFAEFFPTNPQPLRKQVLLYNGANGMLFLYSYCSSCSYPFGVEQLGVAINYHLISPAFDLTDVADLNGDGFADFILYNSANGHTATAISDGGGGFTFIPHSYSPGFTSVRLADYTGDGRADLTLYNRNTGIAYFGTGDGTGNFAFQSLFWSPGYDFVVAQDANGDGKADVILYNSATGTLYTGISNGDGTFHYTYSYWGPGKVLAR